MRANTKVYDTCLKKEVIITESMAAIIKTMDKKAVSKRWVEVEDGVIVSETPATTNTEMTLEEAREAYKEKFEKQVPVNKKNSLEWILSKIN